MYSTVDSSVSGMDVEGESFTELDDLFQPYDVLVGKEAPSDHHGL